MELVTNTQWQVRGRFDRYRWQEDFRGNGYWKWYDEDVYFKPSSAPCSKNQPYDKYEWQSGDIPQTPPSIQTRVTELEGALRPFADLAERIDNDPNSCRLPDACQVGLTFNVVEFVRPTLGDCRKAKRALENK